MEITENWKLKTDSLSLCHRILEDLSLNIDGMDVILSILRETEMDIGMQLGG